MIDTTAAVLPAPRAAVAVTRISLPAPGPGEVLLRIEACGLCHSDLRIAGLAKLPLSPLVLGHEAIGIVEACGEGVDGFAAGDRAGVTFLASTCGQCDYCRSGRERFCGRQVNTGYTRHGAMAERAVAPAGRLARIPADLDSARAAPLCCAGWTAYCAVREAGLEPGQWLGVFGLGGLGHLGVQYGRARGLRIAAADLGEAKLEMARALGAELTVPAAGAGRGLTRQLGGVDAAVVFAAAPEAIEEAFRAVKRAGTVVIAGLPIEPWQFAVSEAVLKGVTIRGSYLGAPADLEEVFRLASAGVGLPRVTTHELAETPALLESMRHGELQGRAVVVFD